MSRTPRSPRGSTSEAAECRSPTEARAECPRRGRCRRREEAGEAVVSNGLSLCSIHHRAFDEDLVGVAPDLRVHVSPRLLEDDDGPMLDVLKGFHGAALDAPTRRLWRPDPERIAVRFKRFTSAA
jgi:putative restriction endonuclease